MASLLVNHQLIATTDVDQARGEVARRFCSHRLALTRRGGRIDMVHNAAAIGGRAMTAPAGSWHRLAGQISPLRSL